MQLKTDTGNVLSHLTLPKEVFTTFHIIMGLVNPGSLVSAGFASQVRHL